MDLEKIKNRVLSLTGYIKEIEIIEQNGHPFALIYPDFEALQEAGIINIKEELRWYGVELYNIKANESEKIRGFKIFTAPIKGKIPKITPKTIPKKLLWRLFKKINLISCPWDIASVFSRSSLMNSKICFRRKSGTGKK